jgi:XRE family transcriptional regulator, aerobic/anaerobic benzoate catabolism transcriptional regulator
MTRKQLARDSGVSERYLAQIEGAKGNISVLVLRQLAKALNVTVDVLLSEGPEPPVELVHTVEFLRRLSLDDLTLARQLLLHQFGGVDPAARHRRIASGFAGPASLPWEPRSPSAWRCRSWSWIA